MEKNKMEEHNNPNLENTGSEVQEATESQVAVEPKAKKAFPKLPVIIGAAVAGVALITVLLILLLGGGGKNVDIAIKENAMPQSVFVLGEEIDLSAGILIVNDNGKTTEIAMNAEGVTVTGYDKNTLGQQTITVSYMEKSVELTVNVVARMQLSDHTADYLVGDALDLSNGRLKITRNDGSNYTVMLKSDKVSVTGFSSETEGAKTLTVKYTSGSETYTTTVNVNVHDVEKVELTRPTKITYNSHDSGVVVAGGLLTLSALDGKIKREIPVTEDMIADFDLSAANKTNSPLTQTVNVMYEGKKVGSYDVRITYTSVTEFKDNAHVVAGLDWSKEEAPEISELQGDTAVDMMELYFDMSPAEQSLLTREETLNMARTAIVYAFNLWAEDVNTNFAEVFGVEYGELAFYCENRAAVEAAIEKLQVEDRPLFKYYNVINNLVVTFGSDEENPEMVHEGQYFYMYPTFDPEALIELVGVFTYMCELDDLIAQVGNDWRDDITKYSSEIEALYDSIVNSDYYDITYSQFFLFASEWSKEKACFDCLYTYYYEVKEDVTAIMQIANIRLPSELEIIFTHILNALNEMDYITNYQYYLIYYGEFITDTGDFFYHYLRAFELSEELLASDNDMMKVLFLELPLNSVLGVDSSSGIYTFPDMLDQLATTEGGYYALSGSLLGVEELQTLLKKYVDIIGKGYEIENYTESDEYKNDVVEMYELYMQLTPAQQYLFLGSVSIFYSAGMLPQVFDTTGTYTSYNCYFFKMITEVYGGMFESEEGKLAYLQLMLATEHYAQRYTNADTWYESFKTVMGDVNTSYAALSDAERAIFDTHFAYIWNEYKSILSDYENPDDGDDTVDLGEWEDEFAALKEAVDYLEIGYYAIQSGRYVYNIFFSAFERAEKIYYDILTNADDEIKYILLYSDLYPSGTLGKEPTEETVYWSYDYVIAVYRSLFTNALISLEDGNGVYNAYMSLLSDFMEQSYDLYWSGDKAKVFEVMRSFRELSTTAKIFFITYFNVDEEFYYYAAIESSFEDFEYSENIKNAGIDLLNVEMMVVIYDYYLELHNEDPEFVTAEDLASAIEALNEEYEIFITAYEALSEEELAIFTEDFGSMYEFYTNIIESLYEDSASLLA